MIKRTEEMKKFEEKYSKKANDKRKSVKRALDNLYEIALKNRDYDFLITYGQDIEDSYSILKEYIDSM